MNSTNELREVATTIWNDGRYMSTSIQNNNVINTYYLDGFFFDISYNVDTGLIGSISMDEVLNLNSNWMSILNNHHLNLN